MVVRLSVENSSAERRCNKCGRVISQYEGFLRLNNYTMPYGSKYDSDILNMTLCVDCLDGIVEKCDINPIDSVDGLKNNQEKQLDKCAFP